MTVFLKFFLLLIFLYFGCVSAHAQTYEVRIRQIEPDGPVHRATCTISETDTCFTKVQIEPKAHYGARQDQYLDVGMKFSNNKMNINFMWNKEYVFSGSYAQREEGEDVLLDKKGQGYKRLLLNIGSLLQKTDPDTSIVIRPPERLVRIEIGVRRMVDAIQK
jgi:hypothetical protein